MQFKLSLFALSSLAMLVAATPLESRKNGFTCADEIVCCTLEDPARLEARMLNSATGLVGTNCVAADTSAQDLDDYCNDNNEIACCPAGGSTRSNCTALDD